SFQVRVGLFQLRHSSQQLLRCFVRCLLFRFAFLHRSHNSIDLRIQRLLLRIQPAQHAIQRFGRRSQPFRRRRQLLHHLFIHSFCSSRNCPCVPDRVFLRDGACILALLATRPTLDLLCAPHCPL